MTEDEISSPILQRDLEIGFGLRLHLMERDAVGKFDQQSALCRNAASNRRVTDRFRNPRGRSPPRHPDVDIRFFHV
jgi:hypothetical protein